MSELTRRNNLEKAKQAEKHMKEANSKAKGGWLSKPDWESAAFSYNEAVKLYAGLGDQFKAPYIQALKGASEAYGISGSEHPAATNAEKAGDLLQTDEKGAAEAVELYKSACNHYVGNDNPDKGVGALFKAAKVAGQTDKKAAIELFREGLNLFVETKRGRFSDKSFKEATSWCVAAECFEGAEELLRMQNKMVVDQDLVDTFQKDMFKNHLSILILDFHRGRYDVAKEHYSEAIELDGFSSSAEGEAAEQLMAASRASSQEQLDKVKKHSQLKYLPAAFARVARTLEFSQEKLDQGPEEDGEGGGGGGMEAGADVEDGLM
eukprot:gb/GEZN01008715.1/.p1 GENE.gb/GEZN01008715.1/~~gb/GEZN01008715.1/.p1  ORF type:complete len:321 (-),score=81.41 gb/GEZN01008715.1/:409-1371(-)